MQRGDEMSYYSMLFGVDKRSEPKDESKYTSKDAEDIKARWYEAVNRLKASKVDLSKIQISRGND